jgi:hypothetical protein
MHKKYIVIGIISAFFSVSCDQPKKTSISTINDGIVTALVDTNSVFTLRIDKPNGFAEYIGPNGKISVGHEVGSPPNVIYELNSGEYSAVLDSDGNGFPEIAVKRSSGERVKLRFTEK